MLQTFYKLNLKLKTILELKGLLQQIWDDLRQFRNIIWMHVLWPVANIMNMGYKL